MVSFYPTNLKFDDCCNILDIPFDCMHQHTQQVLQYQKNDFVGLLQWAHDTHQIPVIFVGFDHRDTGYLWNLRTLERRLMSATPATSPSELVAEFDEIFFSDSLAKWQSSGLTKIWDIRERMALDMRPMTVPYYQHLTLPFPHLWISCQDLWYDTERTLMRIMSWLQLEVQEHKLGAWRAVAQKWCRIQNDSMKFFRELDQIVHATMQGHYHDIPDLSLKQEAIIQHCLIYQHGMNLKTWQLEKFPSNTVDLHSLLEPNQHPLSY